MASISTLPLFEGITKLLITPDGLTDTAHLVESVREDGIKVLIHNNAVSCVLLDPEIYQSMMEIFDKILTTNPDELSLNDADL